MRRHSGSSKAICQQRADGYEKARHSHPTHWSRHIRCWRQLEVEEVWINKTPEAPEPILALALI